LPVLAEHIGLAWRLRRLPFHSRKLVTMLPTETAPFLQLCGISKRYGGVRALQNVEFACRRGTIHAVLGENGAGKSTLIKIVSGVVQPDEGTIKLRGQPVVMPTPRAANSAGVVCIFQELSLMPDLSVAENISIAQPPRRFGLIDERAQRQRAEKLLARAGCEDVNSLSRVRDLSLSRRQMVEIAKALGKDPKLLILDEATSALTSADVAKVHAMLCELKRQGMTIIYISHRMHEIEALADVASVFRNGRHVQTFDMGTRTRDQIVQLMIGREITAQFPPKPAAAIRPPCLNIEGLSWEGRLADISLSVGRGEIVGLGGLDGQGQKELLLALFGVLRGVTGTIRIEGKPVQITSPAAAKAPGAGIALVPEDRKTEGLLLPMSIADNLVIASLSGLSSGLFIDTGREAAAVKDVIARLQIKIGNPQDPVSTLSGGNQQKVAIAKWLMTKPKIILLSDPTRGIDIGTKQEIYRLLRELAGAGAAILLYSTDYDELIGCCDRVAILYDGRIVRELSGEALNERNIIAGALNIVGDATEARAHV
jgi:ribose transport system ATP-binding protein